MRKYLMVFILLPTVVWATQWVPCGLEGKRVTSMVINPYFGYIAVGTSENGVFWSGDRGASWDTVNQGLGSLNITTLTYVAPYGKCLFIDIYAGTDTAGIYRAMGTDTTIQNWEPVNDSLTDFHITALSSDEFMTVYVGTENGKVFKGYDWWIDISEGILGYPVTALKALQGAFGDTAYVAELSWMGYSLFKTVDGGDHWDVLPVLPWIYSIEACGDTVYVGKRGEILKSINGGETWESYTTGIPSDAIISSIVMDSIIYIGTQGYGIYKSADGENWTSINNGLGNFNINCLAIWCDTLYAATDDGIWRYVTEIGIEEDENYELTVYPNPFRKETVISYQLSVIGKNSDPITDYLSPITISIYNLTGRLIRTLPITDHRSPITELTWDGRDDSGAPVPAGIYFVRFDTPSGVLSTKVAKMR